MIHLTSSAIDSMDRIPTRHARIGADKAPPLHWYGLPEGTVELALVCEDPDAPQERPFVHWVLYGLSPDGAGIPEDADQGLAGINDFGEEGYGGPMPPPGHGVHHYHFRLYALDRVLGLKPGATRAELQRAMQGHTLEAGELIGTYAR